MNDVLKLLNKTYKIIKSHFISNVLNASITYFIMRDHIF